ncbi:sensor histidine kinase [Amycolatopsis minnesotensis]|uniref:sensor histidine kinase n=1 Tax=Amycolatopsis minnesotensis TaxID=337894 RepID=UPI0031DCDE37
MDTTDTVDLAELVSDVLRASPETGARIDVRADLEPASAGGDRVRQPRGSGLGLSVVQAIAEAHGGSATATPHPGGGLAVSVTLPSRATPTPGAVPDHPARHDLARWKGQPAAGSPA